jgi:hypothetical protein
MMDAKMRQIVRERAADRCEYCRLQQKHEPTRSFHVEHVIAQQHRGGDEEGNLALACQLCNLLKGTNLTSLDPDTNALTRLFHPRDNLWEDHFRIEGSCIFGITDVGRTTVWLLEMNCEERVALRSVLQEAGEWP